MKSIAEQIQSVARTVQNMKTIKESSPEKEVKRVSETLTSFASEFEGEGENLKSNLEGVELRLKDLASVQSPKEMIEPLGELETHLTEISIALEKIQPYCKILEKEIAKAFKKIDNLNNNNNDNY